MIEKVEIFNYQSHKKTVLEFVPGTNVIIGESDTGKSAAFRAIRWVAENRPLGDAFRSEWGGDTRVKIYTSEGNIIERLRAASKNEYIINGIPQEAFGAGVPEDVINILQLDTANIRSQMDPPFLLSATPGEAARMLNKAASIDDIDTTTANLRKSYSRIDGDIKHNKKQLAEYDEQMKQYAAIPVIEQKLLAIEELEKAFLKRRSACSELVLLAAGVAEIKEKLDKTKHISGLLQKHAETEKQFHSYQERLSLHKKYSVVVVEAEKLQITLGESENVDRGLPILRKAEDEYANWKERNQQLGELKQLVTRAGIVLFSVEQLQKTIERMEEKFHELAPEVCPLCGNRMEGVGN